MSATINSGYELAERLLAQNGNELGKLMAYLKRQQISEADWLELKSAYYPSQEDVRERMMASGLPREQAYKVELQDCVWQVAKAAIGMANSAGGMIIVGITEKALDDPLPLCDPSSGEADFQKFVEKYLKPSAAPKAKWRALSSRSGATEHYAGEGQTLPMVFRQATLHGKPVHIWLVPPMEGQLYSVSRQADGASAERSIFFARQFGDIGETRALEPPELLAWQLMRQKYLGSSRYEAAFKAIQESAAAQTESAGVDRLVHILPGLIDALDRERSRVMENTEMIPDILLTQFRALVYPDDLRVDYQLPLSVRDTPVAATLSKLISEVLGDCRTLKANGKRFLFLESQEMLNELWEALTPEKREPVRQFQTRNNLPRSSTVFAVRGDELERLLSLLKQSNRNYYLTLTGIGGIGKTTLALQAAHCCMQLAGRDDEQALEYRFHHIVWLSAQNRQWLNDGKIQPVEQAISSLDDVLRQVLDILEPQQGLGNLPLDQKKKKLIDILKRQRTLLILDNLETVEDSSLKQFFVNVPEPTKVIVTDRGFAIDGSTIALSPLELADSVQMLRDYMAEQEAGNGLHDKELARLAQVSGGIPRVIAWISHLIIRERRSVELVERLLTTQAQDLYRSLFDWSFAQLSERSLKLTGLIAALGAPASVDLLADLMRLSVEEIEEAAEDPIRLTLLNKDMLSRSDNHRYVIQMDEVTRRYAAPSKPLQIEVAKQLTSYLVEQCGTDGWINEVQTRVVSEHKAHIEWAWDHLQEHHETEDMLKLVYSTCPALGHLGYNQLRLRMAQSMYDLIREDRTRQRDKARLLISHLGWVNFISHEYGTSLSQYEEGLRYAREVGDVRLIAMAIKSIGQIYKEQEDLATAEAKLHEAVALLSELGNTHEGAVTLGALSSLERERGNLDEAIGYLKDAIKMTDALSRADELRVVLKQKLARLLLSAKNYDEAEQANLEAERLNLQLKREAGIAFTRQLEALICEARGDDIGAWQKCREAYELFQSLGMKREIIKDYERLRQAIGRR